jgi:hypothetical protein
MSDLIKLSGLWVNTDKNGNEYFSGGIGFGAKILVMKNTFKDKDSDPDFNLFIAPKKDKEGAKKDEESDIPF